MCRLFEALLGSCKMTLQFHAQVVSNILMILLDRCGFFALPRWIWKHCCRCQLSQHCKHPIYKSHIHMLKSDECGARFLWHAMCNNFNNGRLLHINFFQEVGSFIMHENDGLHLSRSMPCFLTCCWHNLLLYNMEPRFQRIHYYWLYCADARQ
jgi:hypothetical protein